MASLKSRALPRVQEALEKALRARFYKQRISRYTDEVGLERRLRHLESLRIMLLSRLKHDDMKLRLAVVNFRDEEQALLEADEKMLEDVMQKIDRNQKRNHAKIDKYKSDRAKLVLEEKRKHWAELDSADQWRWEMPKRKPQIKIDHALIHPKMKRRDEFKQMYIEVTKRPESRLAEKCVNQLRERYQSIDEDAQDAIFIEQLEKELREASLSSMEMDEDSNPFITHHPASIPKKSPQDAALERILHEIEQTRRSIKYWGMQTSKETEEQLSDCLVKKKYKVKKKRETSKSVSFKVTCDEDELEQDLPVYDDDKETDEDYEKKYLRLKSKRKQKDYGQGQTLSPVPSEDRDTPPKDRSVDERRKSVLVKQLSKNFNPEEFGKRRQSLMREMEEEEQLTAYQREMRLKEFQEAWNEVMKCKYIRGYDPPEVTLPEGQSVTDFVFGNNDEH